MAVNPPLSENIQTAIKVFLDNPEPFSLNFDEPIDLKKFAAELNVLPVSINFSTCYAVNPDGEIAVLDFNNENVYSFLEFEQDPRIRNLVLCQGAKRFPGLAKLVPSRPIDAVDCKYCEGTGIEPMNKKLGYDTERIVCYCGGLGWIPKDFKF